MDKTCQQWSGAACKKISPTPRDLMEPRVLKEIEWINSTVLNGEGRSIAPT
jgi:hypothetical protein